MAYVHETDDEFRLQTWLVEFVKSVDAVDVSNDDDVFRYLHMSTVESNMSVVLSRLNIFEFALLSKLMV